MDEEGNPLERDHSLHVVLPGGQEKNAMVHGSKPVMDLLVTLCASYHLNPTDYTVEVVSTNKNNISFTPNSPIGSLEAERIVLKPRGTEGKLRKPYMPEATVRLLINYNKAHKAVVRVNPRVPLELLLPLVCDKCEFTVDTTVLLRDSQSTEPLDMTKSLDAPEHVSPPGAADSTLRRTKRRAPPPPCANSHQEQQADTQLTGPVDPPNTLEELRESDESDSLDLSLSSSPSPTSSRILPSSSSSRPSFEPCLPSFRGKDFSEARSALAKVLSSSVSKGTLVKHWRKSATLPKIHRSSSFLTQRFTDNGLFRFEHESVLKSRFPTESHWEDPLQRKGMTTFKVIPLNKQKSHEPETPPDVPDQHQVMVENYPESQAPPEAENYQSEHEEDSYSPHGSDTGTPLKRQELSFQEASDALESPPPAQEASEAPDSPPPSQEPSEAPDSPSQEASEAPDSPPPAQEPSDAPDSPSQEASDAPDSPPPAQEPSDAPDSPPPSQEWPDAPDTPPPSQEPSDAPDTPPPSQEPSDAPDSPPPSQEPSDAPDSPPPSQEWPDAPDTPPPSQEPSDAPDSPPPSQEPSDAPDSPPPSQEWPDAPDSPPPALEPPCAPVSPSQEASDPPDSPSPSQDPSGAPDSPPPVQEASNAPDSPPPDQEASNAPDSPPLDQEASNAPDSPSQDPPGAPDTPPPDQEASYAPDSPPPDQEASNAPYSPPTDQEVSDAPDSPPPDQEVSNTPDSPPPDQEASNAPDSPSQDPPGAPDPPPPDQEASNAPYSPQTDQEVSDAPDSPPPPPDLDDQKRTVSPLSEVEGHDERPTQGEEEELEVVSEVTAATESNKLASDCQINSDDKSEDLKSPGRGSVSVDMDQWVSCTDETEEEDVFPPPPPPVFFNEDLDVLEEEQEDAITSSPSQPSSPACNGETKAFSEDHRDDSAAPEPSDKMSAARSRFAQAVALAVQRSHLQSHRKALDPQDPSGQHSALPSAPSSTYQYGA